MFEQPPCPDGHGAECPERACVECGEAVLIGGPIDPDRAPDSVPVPSPDPARASPSGPSARRTGRASAGAASARAVA